MSKPTADPEDRQAPLPSRASARAFSHRTKMVLDARFKDFLSLDQTVFLQCLIDLDDSPYTKHDEDGYFLCTDRFLADNAWQWSEWHRNHLTQTLKYKGLITVYRAKTEKGDRPLRWIKVIYEQLVELLDGHDTINNGTYNVPRKSSYDDSRKPQVNKNKKNTRRNSRGVGTSRKEKQVDPITWGGNPASPSKSITTSPKCFIWADQLKEALRQSGKVRTFVRTKSAKSFATLLRSLGGDEARLERVLNWYCTRGLKQGQYTIQAWSSQSFKMKFDQIESAMNRDLSRNPVVTISAQAQDITSRLTETYTWPNKQELSTAVQSGLNILNELKDKITKVKFDLPRQRVLAAFAKRLLTEEPFMAPEHYSLIWFKDLKRWINCTGYCGSLLPRSISLTNTLFTNHMKSIAANYSHSSLWDELLEAVA